MNASTRVRYRDRQVLDVGTLADEQGYLLERRRRHDLCQHGPGIVTGLGLAPDPAGGVRVAPGMAVDGLGRQLIVGEALVVVLDAEAAADMWIHLDAADDAAETRIVAVAQAAPADAPGPALPPGAAPDRLVYLGRMRRITAGGWGVDPEAAPQLTGLNGQRLREPRTGAGLYLGDRFATRSPGLSVCTADASDAALRVTAPGAVELTGGMTAAGAEGLTVGRDLAFVPPPDGGEPGARPWTVGLAAVPPAAQPAPASPPPAEAPPRLQIEIAPGATAPSERPGRLVIGVALAAGGFAPILDIAATGQVTVHGDLRVGGSVAQAPVPDDVKDPRYLAMLATAWQTGATAADPDAEGAFALVIEDLRLDPVGRRITARLKVDNSTGGSVSGLYVHQTIVGRDLIRQKRLWPDAPVTGFADPGGPLGHGKSLELTIDVAFTTDDWPAGKQIHVTAQAGYRDAWGAARQVSTAVNTAVLPAAAGNQGA